MPLPTSVEAARPASTFGLEGGSGERAQWAGNVEARLHGIETTVGEATTTDEASIVQEIFRIKEINHRINVCRGVPELSIGPFLPGNSAATNASRIQSMINTSLFFSQPTTFAIPGQAPGTVYPCNKFNIPNAGAPILLEGDGEGSTVLSYRGSTAGDAFISFLGAEAAGWPNGPGGRIWYSGLRKMTLQNDGTADSIGMYYFACTHMIKDHVNFSGWRRHAYRARNLADCDFADVGIFQCGSLNGNSGTNYRCIDYGSSGTGSGTWAVDRVQHNAFQIEDFGDGILTAIDGGGNYVNKLSFNQLKGESSGAKSYVMGGDTTSGAVFKLQNTDGITFTDTNLTLLNLRTGQATLPAMMDLDGWCNVQWHGGPGIDLGSAKAFTRLFTVSDAHSTLVHDGLVIGAQLAAGWPTSVIDFSAAARYAYYGCGFKGDPPATVPTWATGTAYVPLLSG